MKDNYYWHDQTVVLNFSKFYIRSMNDILDAQIFREFLRRFLADLKEHHQDLYAYLSEGEQDEKTIAKELTHLFRLLIVFDCEEIDSDYLRNWAVFEEIIEEAYHYWRSLQRYSLIYAGHEEGYLIQNYVEADGQANATALAFYRTMQEKVQGSSDRVYRQLQAGTNAAIAVRYFTWKMPEGYEKLRGIPFISSLMLRTPLILHPRSNKRTNTFLPQDHNPVIDFVRDVDDWICYPARVGSLLIYCYFYRDYITSAVAMANLFELASPAQAGAKKPDAILFFGNPDGTKDTTYYHDDKNDIWVGKVSSAPEIDYFGYTKKAVLTLHNLAMMQRGWLPIHGAMVNIYLKDGRKKGLLFMGDSGAGKSETIEALSNLGGDLIDHQETVFDDMGTVHLDENSNLCAQGTEVGAFVRLDDLDKGTAYKDMDRSIFFNPEKANARVVIPAAPYDVVVTNQKIDCFLYADNYDDKRGLHWFASKEEAMPVFLEGKRFALGTTQEKGLSTTFFANPFGPMQEQDLCRPIIDKIFTALFAQNIPVGEVYTCLGLPNKGDHGIQKAAEAMVDFVKNGKH